VDGGLVAHGEFVVAAGYASVAFKAVDVAPHGVALLVDVGVEGRPTFDPFLRRLSAWSTLIAMAALMPRRRRCSQLVFELYALSARTGRAAYEVGHCRSVEPGCGPTRRLMMSATRGWSQSEG
jgi:hypothetical protein